MPAGGVRTVLYQRILERNARETDPFRSIHESNKQLSQHAETLQIKLELCEKEASRLRQELDEASGSGNGTSRSATAALKNESRLRDKLEKLQDEYNAKIKGDAEDKAEALKTAKRVAELQDLNASQEQEIDRNQRAIKHLQNEVEDAKARTHLAEKQYDGLKVTIRVLQEENDSLKKENRLLETRLVTDKGKLVEEVNALNELVESLKLENEMLKSLKPDSAPKEKKPEPKSSGGWFGAFGGSSSNKVVAAPEPSLQTTTTKQPTSTTPATPKFGTVGIVLPTTLKQQVLAHASDGYCIRYDGSGKDLVATSSSDSTVKVWDTATGTLRATLHGSQGNTMVACDLYGHLVVGASSDKTCKIWNLRTERMLHHLVGHQQKITCVRLCANGEAVITGSADRSLKVWDVSRQTYRQTTTLRHGSTSYSVDVASDAFSAVSGHMDGGLRFWDMRTGDRTMDISDMHESGISSVQFSPASSTLVLTNGLDSCLKLVDVRTGTAVHTFRHADFSTAHSYSKAVLSPNGRYVAAGSNSSGTVFVWDAVHGDLKAKLTGHNCGVCGIDWGRGGNSTQQVSSLDTRGKMILWA